MPLRYTHPIFFTSLELEKAHLILLGTAAVCERTAAIIQNISFSLGKGNNGYKTCVGEKQRQGS